MQSATEFEERNQLRDVVIVGIESWPACFDEIDATDTGSSSTTIMFHAMLCRENVSETENVWSTEFISALLLLQCWMLFVHGWGDTSRMTEPCSTHRHHLHLAAPTVASSTDCYRLVLKGFPQTKMLDQAQVGASSQKSGAGASEQSHPWIVISSCWTTWTWKQKLFPMKKIICFTLLVWNVSLIKGMYHIMYHI